MSSSLVRQSLELVESELDDRTQSLRKTRKNDSRKGLKSKKKGVKGHHSRVLGDDRSEAALQVERAKRTSSSKQDRTTENLKSLLRLSSSKSVDFMKAQEIFDKTVKRRKIIDNTAPETTSSAFTEEDFKKFEEEYFVS